MSRIESTGSYLPEKIVENDCFELGSSQFESMQEFLNGFDQRRHAGEEETGLRMAELAAKKAFEESKYDPMDLDLIVGVIAPSHHVYGDDLNLLQDRLGAWNASVQVVSTACSSFKSALNVADSQIKSGKKKCVLVVASVGWTRSILNANKQDFAFAGDGAGAFIVDAEGDSLIDVHEKNNSSQEVFDWLVMKNPVITGKKEYFSISGTATNEFAWEMIMAPVNIGKELLERNPDITVNKVVFHQSGTKMMDVWFKKLGFDKEQHLHTLNLYANMAAANIPITVDHFVRSGEIQRGDVMFFMGAAAGGHNMAMLWRY